jgi:tetratricopeptide (TPR) repeat protein
VVTTQTQDIQKEPTPEFLERVNTIMEAWRSGSLPFEDASAQIRQLRVEAQRSSHIPNEARAEFVMGYLQGYRTNLTLAEKHFQQARELFQQVQNQARVLSCTLNLGEVARQRGDFNRAYRLFDEAYEIGIEIGEISTATIALSNKGLALLSTGRLEDAQYALETARTMLDDWSENERGRIVGLINELHQGLATVYLQKGQIKSAWEHAKFNLRLAKEVNQPLALGYANRSVADILTELGALSDEDAAEFNLDIDSYYQEALQAFRSIDAEGEVARTIYAQAHSLAQRGRNLHAARRLQEAVIMFSRLGMVNDATKAADLQSQIF